MEYYITNVPNKKVNNKRSTKIEVVGASDYIPWRVWAKNFYIVKDSYEGEIYNQNNESAMKIENGRKPCGEKSRHIHILYFRINDLLVNDIIQLLRCII